MAIPIKPGLLGDPLAPGSVGPRQVVANPATKAASPPLSVGWFCRNGKHPSAQYWNQLNEATNQLALYRTKELFSFVNHTSWRGAVAAAAGSTPRWRAPFHTSRYTHGIGVCVIIAPTEGTGLGYDQNSYAKLTIYSDTTETTTIASETFVYGVNPTGTTRSGDLPSWKVITKVIDGITSGTDLYCKFTNETYGNIMSATVFDLQSMTENFSGYNNQNITTQTPIYDTYRSNVATMQKNACKHGGAKVFNWTTDDGASPLTTTSATSTNIIDRTSTAVSASTPGYTLVMTGKDRLSQSSGVPVVMKAFGKMSAGTNGTVVLVDSTNTVVASISAAFTTTASWQSVSFNLPATSDKYDVRFSTTAGTFSLYAIGCYEYEA